jgi:hypothetical protein
MGGRPKFDGLGLPIRLLGLLSGTMARSLDEKAIGGYVDAASAAVCLPIPEEYRQGVIDNLASIFRQTEGLMALELDSAEEAAPVFRP